MVEPKDMTTEEPEDLPAPEEAVGAVPELAEPLEIPVAAAPASPPGRRAPGTKEVIPFRWKLVGESCGVVLTLFKSIEREDTEAQCDRVRSEGYYTSLRIMDVNEKVAQPAPPEKPPKATPKTAKALVTPKPTRAPVASKTARPQQPAQKAEKPESATKPPREPKPRAPAKAAKTKPATAKSTKKKAGDSGSAASKKRSPKKK